MKGLLRSLVFGILVFAAVLAVWKLFGGDVGGFFAAAWTIIYSIIDGISDVFVKIFKLFGFGGS
jgi:hypothetical protein